MSNPDILFQDDQEQLLYAEILLGDDVKAFLNSSVGEFLIGRAKLSRQEGLERLNEINPYSPEGKQEFEQLKIQIGIADRFQHWCAEAIIDGNNAVPQLQTYRTDGE